MLTDDTLQNCTLELATLGDLKLVERPHSVVLAPHDFCNIKANVKVSSTENGIIFGNIGKLAKGEKVSSFSISKNKSIFIFIEYNHLHSEEGTFRHCIKYIYF